MRQLVWFRRDLRVLDNTALHHACRGAGPSVDGGVVGVFVVCPGMWRAHDEAPCKVDFWLRGLRELSASLAKLNIPLVVLSAENAGDIAPRLAAFAREARCAAVHYNREYEINEEERDRAVERAMVECGIAAHSYHDHVAAPPGTVMTGEGRAYTVFTPFKKAWIRRAMEEGIRILPAPEKQVKIDVEPTRVPESVAGFGFGDAHVRELWPAGEKEAMRRLARFVSEGLEGYKSRRDTPGIDGTSRLSAYLNAGMISPRVCVAEAARANGGRLDEGSPGAAHWISEIVWREFYAHILCHFPRVCMHRAFKPETDRLAWRHDDEAFARWCEGRTGYPIVDAAMRQLKRTGWMHNRLRMIAAMFLTKDLFIDWRWGERYFMQNLIDGDLAPNNGGWQWSASTGTDAAPYFRIFNPVSQSRTCDPEGVFIRALVPELRDVQGDAVHEPWVLPGLLRTRVDYPEPMVDHGESRERVLKMFQALKG